MDEEKNKVNTELKRKRELANARAKKYRSKKRTESQQLNSSMQDEKQNKQVEENNAERKRAMGKERLKRFRAKKRLNVLKSDNHVVHDLQFPEPSHENPPLVLRKQQTTNHDSQIVGTSTNLNIPFVRTTIHDSQIHMPVYYTINGYRVDLNSVALQDKFRLPNGKIIQVRKHISTTTPLAGQTSTKIPSNIHGNNITTIVTSNLRQQTVAMDKEQGTTTGRVGNVTSAEHTLVINNPVMNTQLPQNLSLAPLENSLKDFDKRLDTCKEICEHIIGKINKLRKTNQFKSASKFNDFKNLHINLTYLCEYAVSRFKTLQDKCNDDIETINKLDPPDTDIDNDDIEIVEPHTALINLDSDNEDDEGTCKNNQIPTNEAFNNNSDTVIVTGEILKNILIANLISKLKDTKDKKTMDYNFIKENVNKIIKGRFQKFYLPDNNQNIDESVITMTDVVINGNTEDTITDNIVLNNNSSHMDTTPTITDKNASLTIQITPVATSLTIDNKIKKILNKTHSLYNNNIKEEVNIY